jgi:hypothetical protein
VGYFERRARVRQWPFANPPQSCTGCLIRFAAGLTVGLVLLAGVALPVRWMSNREGVNWEFRGVTGSRLDGEREFAVIEVTRSSGRGRSVLCASTTNYIRVRDSGVTDDLPFRSSVVLRGRVSTDRGARQLLPTAVTVTGMADEVLTAAPFPGCPA